MRDAFGGAFMIKIILIFLGLYIVFMALALNYAKAFRVKNQIINYIEQYEGYEKAEGAIKEYITQVSYYVPITALPASSTTERACYDIGYCITPKFTSDDSGNRTYYLVETYIRLEFPFFNLNITIPIRGETRVVTNV